MRHTKRPPSPAAIRFLLEVVREQARAIRRHVAHPDETATPGQIFDGLGSLDLMFHALRMRSPKMEQRLTHSPWSDRLWTAVFEELTDLDRTIAACLAEDNKN